MQSEIDKLQAQKDSTVPRCFTECSITRRLRQERGKQTRAEESLASLKKQRDDLAEKITAEEDRVQKIKEQISSL